MRLIRLISFLVVLFVVTVPLGAQSDRLAVMGKLTRVVSIGAETTGWAIELNPVLTVNGKQVSSLEVKSSNPKKLAALENKTVRAVGQLSNALGVETGQRPVLTLSSIKEIKQKGTAADKPSGNSY